MTTRQIKKAVTISAIKLFTIIAMLIAGFFIPIGEVSGVQSVQRLIESNGEEIDLALMLFCVLGVFVTATVRIVKRLCSKRLFVTNEIDVESEYVQFFRSTERWVLVCLLFDTIYIFLASLFSTQDGNDMDFKGFVFLAFVIVVWWVFRIINAKFAKHCSQLEARQLYAKAEMLQRENEAKYQDNNQSDKEKETSNEDNIQNLDSLLKYKKLLDDGIITQEEFDKKKKELLK